MSTAAIPLWVWVAPGVVCRAFLHIPVHALLSSGQQDWDRMYFSVLQNLNLIGIVSLLRIYEEKTFPTPSKLRGIYLHQGHED